MHTARFEEMRKTWLGHGIPTPVARKLERRWIMADGRRCEICFTPSTCVSIDTYFVLLIKPRGFLNDAHLIPEKLEVRLAVFKPGQHLPRAADSEVQAAWAHVRYKDSTGGTIITGGEGSLAVRKGMFWNQRFSKPRVIRSVGNIRPL